MRKSIKKQTPTKCINYAPRRRKQTVGMKYI